MSSIILVSFIFLGLLLLLILVGVPIAFALGMTSIFILLLPIGGDFRYTIISNLLFNSVFSFVLLAFPFYLLLGRLMNRVGVTEDIFDFANAIMGHLPGGIGYVNIGASLIFSGMSGSSIADVAGLGRVEYKAMRDHGYPKKMSLGITASSSIMGPIMPPSILVIIYAVIAQVSVGDMFIAGVIPAFMVAGTISIFVYLQVLSMDQQFKSAERFRFRNVLESFIPAFPSLMIPVIIIGGILMGFFTATEAGAVAVVYVILLGWIRNDFTYSGLAFELRDSMIETAAITFIIMSASIYGFVAIQLNLPSRIADSILGATTSPLIFLFLVAVILIIMGTFLDKISAIVLLVPVFIPIISEYQIDPVHFGVIMVVTLMLGGLTPPMGGAIYALEKVTDATLEEVIHGVLPYYIPILATIILLILFPSLSLYLLH